MSGIHLSTQCIRGGNPADPVHGAVLPPIHQSTTFRQRDLGGDQAYTYSRASNPTVSALEARLGALEGALDAVCFGTGMAAISTLGLALCSAGDTVVCSDVVYGGTFRLLQDVLSRFGVRSIFADPGDPVSWEAALSENPRLVIIETPANPTLKLVDIPKLVDTVQGRGAAAKDRPTIIVDNTFLTPVLQKPLELGADISLYSTTKYIDGHNATVGGAIVLRDPELRDRLVQCRTTLGTIQSPHNAWLTLQGLKTLPLRMAQHSANALKVARALQNHPQVEAVRYPDLESFPQHELAGRQQGAGGGLVTCEVHGGLARAAAVVQALELCTPAENLGAVETLVTHPATMTHHSYPPEQRLALGITDGLLRLSIGLEDADEIIADLDQALRCNSGEVAHA